MNEHYADTADEADRIFTAIHEKRIEVIRKAAARLDTRNPSGDCWYCGESVGVERRFCNRECSDCFERETK